MNVIEVSVTSRCLKPFAPMTARNRCFSLAKWNLIAVLYSQRVFIKLTIIFSHGKKNKYAHLAQFRRPSLAFRRQRSIVRLVSSKRYLHFIVLFQNHIPSSIVKFNDKQLLSTQRPVVWINIYPVIEKPTNLDEKEINPERQQQHVISSFCFKYTRYRWIEAKTKCVGAAAVEWQRGERLSVRYARVREWERERT